jgi:hypothetical protein
MTHRCTLTQSASTTGAAGEITLLHSPEESRPDTGCASSVERALLCQVSGRGGGGVWLTVDQLREGSHVLLVQRLARHGGVPASSTVRGASAPTRAR